MGMIFPLSTPGRIVLIIIAIVVIAIWSMFQFPNFWKGLFGRKKEQVQEPPKMPAPEKRKNG